MTQAKRLGTAALVAASLLASPPNASASSHREALAVLNEPCADTTDIYAWVKPGSHDKLYLIANFLPLHEPGQGNQGLRPCTNYRYEFHVAKGVKLKDETVYRVEFNRSKPTDDPPDEDTGVGGGNELLFQISGIQETYKVVRVAKHPTTLGSGLTLAPNFHGPQTDRLVNALGPFAGYDSGDPTSRTVDLYDDAFAASFIHTLSNGARAFTGQRDDPFYLDEKGIFDLVNLCQAGLFNIPGARPGPCKDVFAGFNVFTIALELPITDLFPGGVPHNGTPGNDSLLRVWFTVSRPEVQIVDDKDPVDGYRYHGPYRQVGRQALPLFNAGLVGVSRQTLYLRSDPSDDVKNFAGDILNPVLVRDAEALGIYAALGIDPDAAGLKHNRLDIISAINLDNYPTPGAHSIPVANGFTGDVITLDAAIDSQFPNGRSLQGGLAPNKEQVDVSDVLISLIVAGNPFAGAGDGVNSNDKPYLSVFPFVAAPHSGLNGGHGAAAP